MLRLTFHAPTEHADIVAETLTDNPYTCDVTRLVGAGTRPVGDVLGCCIPREAVPPLLESLAECGIDERSVSIVIDGGATVLSEAAADAERRAAGAPDDALLWQVVQAGTRRASELSVVYLVFMVLATMLAAIGLLSASSVLIVGAMILGPEFGALAHLCVSTLGRDARGVKVALVQLLVGFGVAIAATAVLVLALDVTSLVEPSAAQLEFQRTIVAPSWIGLVVACIAGTAGVLTLTSAKGEALIGVLVSVTTIPAAAEMSIGMSFTDADRIIDGAATLGINLAGMIVAGAATLVCYRVLQQPAVIAGRHRSPTRPGR